MGGQNGTGQNDHKYQGHPSDSKSERENVGSQGDGSGQSSGIGESSQSGESSEGSGSTDTPPAASEAGDDQPEGGADQSQGDVGSNG